MLLKKTWTEDCTHCYEVTGAKRIVFDVEKDNSIKKITLIDWRKNLEDCSITYEVKGLYYMENLTPEDEGEIDLIDVDKLLNMIKFDELDHSGVAAC